MPFTFLTLILQFAKINLLEAQNEIRGILNRGTEL